MKPYSYDLRVKVLHYSFTHSILDTATTFGIGTNTVFLLKKLYDETGDVQPRKSQRIYERLITTEGETFLQALILTEPDLSINDLRNTYEEKFGVYVSHGTMVNALKRLNLTYKKKFC
jgi:transposase